MEVLIGCENPWGYSPYKPGTELTIVPILTIEQIDSIWPCVSLRVQPPLIAARRYGRDARESVCDLQQKFHTDDVNHLLLI